MAKTYPTARELTSHRVNGVNEHLRIFVLDGPGPGNACHEYAILVPQDTHDEACFAHAWANETFRQNFTPYNLWSRKDGSGETEGATLYVDFQRHEAAIVRWSSVDGPEDQVDSFDVCELSFQNGPIKEAGVNGITQEALLAVLKDRLEGFQSGQFKCHDNEVALDHIESAKLWLFKRTLERVARNVEGTMQQ